MASKQKDNLAEAKEFLHSILDHSESLSALRFYAKLKNGAEFKYEHDSEKIARERKREEMNGVEIFSAVTHTVGASVSVIALVLFVVFSVLKNDPVMFASFLTLGVAMTLYFVFGALSYYFPEGTAKRTFITLRSIFVYILLAAFVMPLYTLSDVNAKSIVMLAVICALAAIGAIGDTVWGRRVAFIGGAAAIVITWLYTAVNGFLTSALVAPALWELWFGVGSVLVTLWAVFNSLGKIFVIRRGKITVRDIASLLIAIAASAHFCAWLIYLIS